MNFTILEVFSGLNDSVIVHAKRSQTKILAIPLVLKISSFQMLEFAASIVFNIDFSL